MKKQLSWQTWLLIGIAIYLLIPWFIVQSGLLHAAETIPEPALANQSMRSVHNLDQVLDKVEEEQVYLRRLANIRLAVEKELAIVKLIRECGDLDAVCTGQGLALKTPLEEEDETPPPVSQPSPPQPSPLSPAPPPLASVESSLVEGQALVREVSRAPEIPVAIKPPTPIQVYQGKAVVEYLGHRQIVREGDFVGPFQVGTIALDHIHFQSSGSSLRMPLLEWAQPTGGEYVDRLDSGY